MLDFPWNIFELRNFLKSLPTVKVWIRTEALIEGVSLSKEHKNRFKNLIDENMLTLRAIPRRNIEALTKLDFPHGAIEELKEKAKNIEIVTVNASLASSFDFTPLIASISSSPPRPVTPSQMTLEKLKKAVGHVNTRVNDSKRKDIIHIVFDKLFEISSMKKILFDLESLIAISTISSDGQTSGIRSGRVTP